MINRTAAGALVTLCALYGATPAAAADDWAFTLTPYLWAIGIDGDLRTSGQDLHASMGISDVMDHLDMGGAALFEAAKGHWVSYAQVDYMELSSGDIETRVPGVDADLRLKGTLGTAATGYRFHVRERSTIDVMLGVRGMRLDSHTEIQGIGHRSSRDDIYDGVVALRPRVSLTKYWTFSPSMVVGAGDSDLTWELAPEIVYEYCGTEIRFGYRKVSYDFEKGDNSADLSYHGPIVGVGFRF